MRTYSYFEYPPSKILTQLVWFSSGKPSHLPQPRQRHSTRAQISLLLLDPEQPSLNKKCRQAPNCVTISF
ncbi:MAG: hypothetical protein ACK58L_10460 [Planctomycetota bacterium]